MTQQWKPIASAPKDGSEIWAYNGEQARMRWTQGECYALWIWADDLLSDADPNPEPPTHWMPLPAAPCRTCNGHGLVGGLTQHSGYDAEPCPECSTPPASAQDDAKDDSIALDKLADYIADNWPDKKYGLEEICQRLNATWPGAFMPPSAAPAVHDARGVLTDDEILDRWDTHVGDSPITESDKLCFAREIEHDLLSKLSQRDSKDAARYRWLRDHECCSLSLERDSDHACNYLSAAEWIDAAPEHFRDDPVDEIDLMKSTNTIWRLQVYPSTPIGFWVLHRATLDAAIDDAMFETTADD